jgi:radical SAM-linked protein
MSELPITQYAMPDQPRQRVRLTYEKGEAIKFISHQDEFRLWERTLRRANLPLLYSQGFNPQPEIQFAAPLGVGITGARELVDITFEPGLPVGKLDELIRAKLPPGVTLHGLQAVPLKTPALQSLLIGADYTIFIYAEANEIPPNALPDQITTLLAQTTTWRERERKGEKYIYNLRPLIFELLYEGYNVMREEHRIFLRVQMRAGATGRPDEVVAALGFDQYARTLRRDRLYFADEPVDVAVFAAYPVVQQAEISAPVANRRKPHRRRGHVTNKAPHKTGRTISERAADEFV